MSRVEENKEIINKLGRVRFTSGDMAMLASVLTDISQSLAVIADTQLEYLHSETEPPMFKEVSNQEFQPKIEEPPVLDRCDQCIRKEKCNNGLRTREALKHDCPHFIQSEEERIAYWEIDGCLRKENISDPGTSYLYAVHCSNCGYHTDFTTSRIGMGGPKICPQCSMKMKVNWVISEEETDGN